MTFNALYGVFDVGYQQSRVWGTCAFCDDYDTDPGIMYTYMMGPWTFAANWDKRRKYRDEASVQGVRPPDQQGEGPQLGRGRLQLGGTNNDHDVYQIWGIYRWATGQAGLRFEMDYDAGGKIEHGANQARAPYRIRNEATSGRMGEMQAAWYHVYEIAPYVQWNSGPFDLEGEFRYVWGRWSITASESGGTGGTDVDRNG